MNIFERFYTLAWIAIMVFMYIDMLKKPRHIIEDRQMHLWPSIGQKIWVLIITPYVLSVLTMFGIFYALIMLITDAFNLEKYKDATLLLACFTSAPVSVFVVIRNFRKIKFPNAKEKTDSNNGKRSK